MNQRFYLHFWYPVKSSQANLKNLHGRKIANFTFLLGIKINAKMLIHYKEFQLFFYV